MNTAKTRGASHDFFMHIGLGKTGSTSLQAFLRQNKELLADKGICYPDVTGRDNGNATPAVLSLLGSAPAYFLKSNPAYSNRPFVFENLWQDILDEWDKPDHALLVSSEEFSMVDPAELSERCRSAAQRRKVIVFVRRQDQIIESTYLQLVCAGLCRTDFNGYLDSVLERSSEDWKMLCYGDFLDRWAAAFGRPNIDVLVYEKQSSDTHLYESFLGCLGISLTDEFSLPPHLNPSLHPFEAEFIRSFDHETHSLADVSTAARRARNRMRLPESAHINLMSSDRRQQVLAEFEEQNRYVALRYLNRQVGTLFRPFIPTGPLEDIDALRFGDEFTGYRALALSILSA